MSELKANTYCWDIDDNQYAYIFIPGSNNHISEKITDGNTLSLMFQTLAEFDVDTYNRYFNEMNAELILCGYKPIEIAPEFVNEDRRIFVLTNNEKAIIEQNTTSDEDIIFGAVEQDNPVENLRKFVNIELAEIKNSFESAISSMQEIVEKTLNDAINRNESEYGDKKQELIDTFQESINRVNAAKDLLIEKANIITTENIFNVLKQNPLVTRLDEAFNEYDDMLKVSGITRQYGPFKYLSLSHDVMTKDMNDITENIRTIDFKLKNASEWISSSADSITGAVHFVNMSASTISRMFQLINNGSIETMVNNKINELREEINSSLSELFHKNSTNTINETEE